jgi:hypothetical protein
LPPANRAGIGQTLSQEGSPSAWAGAVAGFSAAASHSVQFSMEEVKLLLQSLDHCLATCAKKAARGRQAPCEHCDRTQILRQRLNRAIGASRVG